MAYLTKKLDIKHFNFDSLSVFRGLIIQTIKMKHSQIWFTRLKYWNIKDGVQDGRHFKQKSAWNQIHR